MPSIKVNSEDVMTIGEAAKTLSVTRQTIYDWIEDKKIIPMVFGERTYIPTCEVNRMKNLKEGKPA